MIRYILSMTVLCIEFHAFGGLPGREIKSNNDGVRLLEEERPYEAYQKFIEGLSTDAFRPELHYNLGLAFERSEDFDAAMKEYSVAYKTSQSDEIRFYAKFNMARLAGERKQIDQALQHYQQALAIRPDSIEVKTNIELLIKDSDKNGGGDGGEGGGKGGEQGDRSKPVKNPKSEPQSFKSKELKPSDVRKIFEELERQEQKIRAKQNGKKGDRKTHAKDW